MCTALTNPFVENPRNYNIMEVIEDMTSNEWFHLIDHMYAKWPKINFPFLASVEESELSSHLVPEGVRSSTHRRQNMKRKRGRKRKSMQKPIKKRLGAKVPGGPKRSNPRKEGMMGKKGAAPPRRISIIQTRAQKSGVGAEGKVGVHYRQCPCCEGALLKPRMLAKVKAEAQSANEEGEEKKAPSAVS